MLASRQMVMFPALAVGVTPVVNFGTGEQMVLTPDVLTRIFTNNITRWDDSDLLDLNPVMYVQDVPTVVSVVQ